MIDSIAQNVGWLFFLATLMAGTMHVTTVVLKLVWDQSAKGETVDVNDALIATAKTVTSWFKLVKSSWFATVCAVASFLLLWVYTDAGLFVSLGYSAMTYVIGGLLTPLMLRRLKPILAAKSSQVFSPVESIDS